MKKGLAFLCSLSLMVVLASTNANGFVTSTNTSVTTTQDHMVGA